jgi:SAM-dependent methyltransferase
MEKDKNDLIAEVAEYYSLKLATHGETPQGVDWNGPESQVLRFKQLCKCITGDNHFSINDLGCGYGAFYDYLASGYNDFSYSGIDISEDMIRAAAQRVSGYGNASFVLGEFPDQIADYGIASGIFNVRFKRSDDEWWAYLEATLATLDRTSKKGFAFNCLTAYSDKDKMRENLYYADPTALFDLCKRRYSRNVALLHDYGLYEFTIIVRKEP